MAIGIPKEQQFGAMADPNYWAWPKDWPKLTAKNIPGGQYGLDMRDQTAQAYRQSGPGAAVGTFARGLTAAPIAATMDVVRPLAPLGNEMVQAGRAFIGGSPSATANAVGNAQPQSSGGEQDQPFYPTEFRRGYEQGQGATGAATGVKMSDAGDGIQKFVDANGKVTYTNMGQAGYDDLQRKRSTPLASATEFLKGVPEGRMVPPGGGGGGPGNDTMISVLQAKLDRLDAASEQLLGSRSIVDNWRGRQLQKRRDRMAMAGASLMSATAQQQRAANEMPIAKMGDTTTRRGQDYGLAQHLPKMLRDAEVNRLWDAGSTDAARALGTVDQREYMPKAPVVQAGPSGTTVVSPERNAATGQFDIQFQPYPTREQFAEQEKRAAERAAAQARLGK